MTFRVSEWPKTTRLLNNQTKFKRLSNQTFYPCTVLMIVDQGCRTPPTYSKQARQPSTISTPSCYPLVILLVAAISDQLRKQTPFLNQSFRGVKLSHLPLFQH